MIVGNGESHLSGGGGDNEDEADYRGSFVAELPRPNDSGGMYASQRVMEAGYKQHGASGVNTNTDHQII